MWNCEVWISLISCIVALVSVGFAVLVWRVSQKALGFQTLAELRRDYAQHEVGKSAELLWNFYRERCDKKPDRVTEEFGKFLKEKRDANETKAINQARRQILNFYQSLAVLHQGQVVNPKILYNLWTRIDLGIIPQVVVLLERALWPYLDYLPVSNDAERDALVKRYVEPVEVLYENSIEYFKVKKAKGNWVQFIFDKLCLIMKGFNRGKRVP